MKSTKPCSDATQNADVISFDKTYVFPQSASLCESVICGEKKDIHTQSSTGDNDKGEEEGSNSQNVDYTDVSRIMHVEERKNDDVST